MQAAGRGGAIPSDRSEYGSFGDLCGGKPGAKRANRTSVRIRSKGQTDFTSGALLIGFRLANGDDNSVGREFEVIYIDAGQLRPSKTAREANERNCAIPETQKVLAPRGDDFANVGRKKRDLSVLRGAEGAANTFESLADDKVMGRCRRSSPTSTRMKSNVRRAT